MAPSRADPSIADAVRNGDAAVVPLHEAEALIWSGGGPEELEAALAGAPDVSWVQLPSAGIERYSRLIDGRRVWTCAKGIYAQPVAEHALSLALAGMHRLPHFARAHTWQKVDYQDLHGSAVTIVGGGGITAALLELLAPFHTSTTVVRRHPRAMDGADRVVGTSELREALKEADVVVLTLALTAETEGIIGEQELRAMKPGAWLVNVARGKLIDTNALVDALRDGRIGGAALDVTDPEPLPDDHPLWGLDNCLITPHCANPPSYEREQYAALVRDNVRRRIAHESLAGIIDPLLGY
ncbi:MAG TPA: D-isomer specific 2-hydroxyacid dehydrogenase family protein [Chloroflexota bacterium]